MNGKELFDKLDALAEDAAGDNIDIDYLDVSGYLLGDGIRMEIKNIYIDGSTLHLDFERAQL